MSQTSGLLQSAINRTHSASYTTLTQYEILVEQLQGTLNTRVIIEQAMGILAERGHLGMNQAFATLRPIRTPPPPPPSHLARAVIDGAPELTNLLARPAPTVD
ncbi:ANTAR domain-containing protein [Nonomuraea typhae]|uniref:ANTAR domain-containing protein n=1 Tax=Nonomuraea typhae TaxID=2603600 RepID=UPI0012FC1254|nr:ANTAR domain-containing protein [Nonomuraea typhae]